MLKKVLSILIILNFCAPSFAGYTLFLKDSFKQNPEIENTKTEKKIEDNENKSVDSKMFLDMMGLEGNRYPFEKKWGTKFSPKKNYFILSYPRDMGDLSTSDVKYQKIKINERYFYITPIKYINCYNYAVGTAGDINFVYDIRGVFDTNWKITRLDIYDYSTPKTKYYVFEFNKDGKVTKTTVETMKGN